MPAKKRKARKRKPVARPLTERELRFAEIWYEGNTAKLAFLKAGFTAKSDAAIRKAASMLLAKPGIMEHVNKLARRTMVAAEIDWLLKMEVQYPGAKDYIAKRLRTIAGKYPEERPYILTTAHKT